MGGRDKLGLRSHGPNQLGYGRLGAAPCYGYSGQNHQSPNYYNEANHLTKVFHRDDLTYKPV